MNYLKYSRNLYSAIDSLLILCIKKSLGRGVKYKFDYYEHCNMSFNNKYINVPLLFPSIIFKQKKQNKQTKSIVVRRERGSLQKAGKCKVKQFLSLFFFFKFAKVVSVMHKSAV